MESTSRVDGADVGDPNQQCNGFLPQPNVATFLNSTIDYELSRWICCNNHDKAESRGYLAWDDVNLFDRLPADKEEHVFYDSVCGIPLFVAPRGRSFDEFKSESLHHGWPSFRPEEIILENVIIHRDGRMESKCLTHLGHNLPTKRTDRYCIDLVCISGAPLSTATDEELITLFPSLSNTDGGKFLSVNNFNASQYDSKAEQFSGNYPRGSKILLYLLVALGVVISIGAIANVFKRCQKKHQGNLGNPHHQNSVSISKDELDDQDALKDDEEVRSSNHTDDHDSATNGC